MERFRPNIVLEGGRAWDEDDWSEVSIGGHSFQLVKPCSRCKITTLDQTTGARSGDEPLRTLSTFRKWDSGVMFGWNATGPTSGTIAPGARCDVVSRRSG